MDDAIPTPPRPRRLLLIRGLTRESGHWGPFTEVLQRALPHYQVLAVDLPGTGTLFQRSPGYRVSDFADAVLEQLATRDAASTVILGMSLGGMVTLELLGRNLPEFVGGVLINTSEASMSRWDQRMSPRAILGLLGALASPSLRLRESVVHRLTSVSPVHSLDESALWVQIARDRPVAKRVFAGQVWAAARYRAPQRIEAPLLWLGSKQDRFVDLECTRNLWERFGGDLRIYPFAGHDLALDAPAWTARKIRTFVQEKVDAGLGAHVH